MSQPIMLFALPKGKIIKTKNISKRSDVEFMNFIESKFNAKFIRIKKKGKTMKKVDLSNFPFSRYTNFTYTNYVIDLEVSGYDKAERTGFIEKSKLKDYETLNKFYANQCVIEKTYSRESDDRYMFSYDSDIKSDTSDIFAGI